MSITPALMQVPPANEFLEIMHLFTAEITIQQVNHDLLSVITLIGRAIKSADTSQEDRERFFSYMLSLQKIYHLINDLNDISGT